VWKKRHPDEQDDDPAAKISQPPIKRRRKRVADENVPPTNNILNVVDYAAIQSSESTSTISASRMAAVLKERHPESKLPAKTAVYNALINRTHAFDGLFVSLELPRFQVTTALPSYVHIS